MIEAMKNKVMIIGGGLAGCEAAWQLARAGIPVELYEMRPNLMTPAHNTPDWESWYAASLWALSDWKRRQACHTTRGGNEALS